MERRWLDCCRRIRGVVGKDTFDRYLWHSAGASFECNLCEFPFRMKVRVRERNALLAEVDKTKREADSSHSLHLLQIRQLNGRSQYPAVVCLVRQPPTLSPASPCSPRATTTAFFVTVARELSDPRSDPSSLKTPPHEVIKTNDSVTINVDLPGCKKEDVDAQISEDSGTKTLTISAVRKRTHRESSHANESDPDADSNAESAEVPSMPPSSFTEENFELSFRIGDEIDASGVRGTMEDGVLSLVLPRVAPEPPAEPIDIPIAPPAERQTEKRNPGASHAGEGSASGRGRMNQEDGASTHISLS